MKKTMRKIIFIVFFVLLGLLASLFLFWKFYDHQAKQQELLSNYKLSNKEIALLKDGDIILRHGYGLVSDLIVKNFDEKYDISHCAILRIEGEHYKVIHSVSQSLSDFDGVQSESLSSFIKTSKENSVIVVRLKTSPDSLKRISNKAEYYLKRKIPFDNSFDLKDSSEIYCSELLWKIILEEFKIDIFKGKNIESKEHFKFDCFLDTNRFQIIINHHLKKSGD